MDNCLLTILSADLSTLFLSCSQYTQTPIHTFVDLKRERVEYWTGCTVTTESDNGCQRETFIPETEEADLGTWTLFYRLSCCLSPFSSRHFEKRRASVWRHRLFSKHLVGRGFRFRRLATKTSREGLKREAVQLYQQQDESPSERRERLRLTTRTSYTKRNTERKRDRERIRERERRRKKETERTKEREAKRGSWHPFFRATNPWRRSVPCRVDSRSGFSLSAPSIGFRYTWIINQSLLLLLLLCLLYLTDFPVFFFLFVQKDKTFFS